MFSLVGIIAGLFLFLISVDGLVELDLEEVRDDFMRIAKKHGDYALEHFGEVHEVRVKNDSTIVTIIDEEVNERIILDLKKCSWYNPNIRIIAEESNKVIKIGLENGWVILVDPIDGTNSYFNHKPGWCVLLTLLREGVSVVGVIYDPIRNVVWDGVNGVPHKTMNPFSSEEVRVSLPFHDRSGINIPKDLIFVLPDSPVDEINEIIKMFGITKDRIVSDGSYGTRGALIREGLADTYPNRESSMWDTGPLPAMGLKCYDLRTMKEIFYSGFNTKHGYTMCVSSEAVFEEVGPPLHLIVYGGESGVDTWEVASQKGCCLCFSWCVLGLVVLSGIVMVVFGMKNRGKKKEN